METTLSDLRSRLDALEWDDAGREAYDNAKAEWDAAVEDIRVILEQVGGAIQTAMENYQATEAANAARFGA